MQTQLDEMKAFMTTLQKAQEGEDAVFLDLGKVAAEAQRKVAKSGTPE